MVGEVAVGGLPAMLCSSASVKRKKCDEFASLNNFLSIHFFSRWRGRASQQKENGQVGTLVLGHHFSTIRIT